MASRIMTVILSLAVVSLVALAVMLVYGRSVERKRAEAANRAYRQQLKKQAEIEEDYVKGIGNMPTAQPYSLDEAVKIIEDVENWPPK